jgi:hypothetical protein
MAFDADAYRAAREPWTCRIGGRLHTAQPVSQEALLRFQGGMERAARTQDATLAARVTRALWRTAFPWRPSMLWRGDPVPQLLALEPPAHEAALLDFFAWLGARPPAPPARTTSGSSASSAAPPPSPSGNGVAAGG